MRLLRRAPLWMFFAALAVSPWYYGGTTAMSVAVIDWILAASLLLFVTELIVSRRKPVIPMTLLALVLALLAISGWMVLNARAVHDGDFSAFTPIANLFPALPGAVDYPISAAWMIRGALLLGVILFVAEMSQDDRTFLQICYAIGIIAGSICLLGLLQKATGARMIFWQQPWFDNKEIYPFFATYFYHANAGAFLNLTLPVTTGLALRTFLTPSNALTRALWVTVFALNLVAIAANTSRGGHVVGGFILLAMLIQLGPTLVRRITRAKLNVSLAGAGAILFLLFALARVSHLEMSHKRWEQLSEQTSINGRIEAARVAWEIIPHAGVFGFGPGTFRVVFPVFNAESPNRVSGFWRFLHEDYLQTIIEWGWVGSALWGMLFFGGIVVAVRAVRRQRKGQRARGEGQSGKLKAENGEASAFAQGFGAIRPVSKRSQDEISASQRVSVSEFPIWLPRRRLLVPLIVIALGGVAIHAIADFPLQIYSIELYVATYLGICWGSARWDTAKS